MAQKKAAKKIKKIEKRDIKKSFWFDLSKKEKEDASDSLVKTMTKKIKKELQFNDVKKKWNGDIKELDSECNHYHKLLEAGKEWRELECIEIKDFAKLEVRYMHGTKLIDTREMNGEERQIALTINNKPVTETKLPKEPKTQKEKDVQDVMRSETNKSTKKSAVDPADNAVSIQ